MKEQEKQKILYEFNKTDLSYDSSRLIHRIFKDQALASPDRIALVEETRTMTYQELDRRSDILAAMLIRRGIAADQPVGVNLDRGIDFSIAIIAALKSGGCYVPLDPHYPSSRLKYIVDAVSCPVIISVSDGEMSDCGRPVIGIDRIDWRKEVVPDDYVMSEGRPCDLAYMLFTSGSTGEPKGVEIEHRNLLNLFYWEKNTFPHDGPYNASQAASICFDASVREFWCYMPDGATLYFIPREILLDPPNLAKWLCDNRIEECYLPTPVAMALIETKWPRECSLNNLYTGGERLTFYPPATFPCNVVNLYGPAECTVESTYSILRPGVSEGEGYPHIGRPVSNCHVYILDQDMNPVPVGEEGELYIGGMPVGRGYAGRPDLTDQVYVKNTNPDIPDKIMYKTGDLAKFRPDGNIDFIGRNDFQVKIRGFRIELSEIEAIMNRHDDVKRSAVTVIDDGGDRKFLAAYVVLEHENPEIMSELFSLCSEHLPEYMVPTTLTVLDAMPLTHNGKTDRKNLPRPVFDSCRGCEESFLTGTQIMMINIWNELLNVRPGPDDNFFNLGGHSLMAMRVCSRIEEQTGRKIPLRTVFDYPILRDFAAFIDKLADASKSSVPFIRLPRDTDEFPASGFQAATWRQHQFDESGISFNIPLEISISGSVDHQLLHKAFARLIVDHELLRADFHDKDSELYLRINDPFEPEIPYDDLSELPEPECLNQYMSLRELEGCTVFDLEKSPVWRARLIRLADEDYKLLLTMHHVIHDGWSSGILLGELEENYEAFALGNIPSRRVEYDYVDYVSWFNRFMASGVRDQQLAFWRQKLKDLPPPCKLSFQIETDNPGYEGDRCSLFIEPELTRKMKRLAEEHGITLFILLQAVFQSLLYKYSHRSDLLTGAVSANRRHPATENITGEFINTITLRSDFSGNPSFAEVLERIKAVVLEALENQDLPFVDINRELARQYGRNDAAFQHVCMLQNFEWNQKEFAGMELTYREVGNHTTKVDILTTFMEANDGLEAFFEFNTSLYNKTDIEGFVEEYKTLSRAFCDTPELRLSEFMCRHLGAVKTSCYIVGDNYLANAASEVLKQAGYDVSGIISSDTQVLGNAEKGCIRAFTPLMFKKIASELDTYDYVFNVLSDPDPLEDLPLSPRKEIINYFAGTMPGSPWMYPVCRSIMNRRDRHGITWYSAERPDQAEIKILKTDEVRIDPGETSYTLHLKCMQAAMVALQALACELLEDRVSSKSCDMLGKTLMNDWVIPHNGIVDWNKPAEEIAAMVRACFLGPDWDNSFGRVKFLYRGNWYGIYQASAVSGKAEPGKIVSIDKGSLRIGTGAGILEVSGCCRLSAGNAENTLKPGEFIIAPPENEISLIEFLAMETSVFEASRVAQLRHAVPFHDVTTLDEGNSESEIVIEPDKYGWFNTDVRIAAASVAVYLAWRCMNKNVTVPVACKQDPGIASGLFSSYVPWSLKPNFDLSFEENLSKMLDSLEQTFSSGPVAFELRTRYRGADSIDRYPTRFHIAESKVRITRAPESLCRGFDFRFGAFLDAAAKNPGVALKELYDLNENELRCLQIESSGNLNLTHCLIEEFACKFGDKTAIRSGEKPYTYRQIVSAASDVAARLLASGYVNGEVVAYYGKPSADALIVMLGILKAGCIFVPLPTDAPGRRIDLLLELSGANIILKPDDIRLPAGCARQLKIIDPRNMNEAADGHFQDLRKKVIHGDSPAMIVFNRTKSGVPEALTVSQRALSDYAGITGERLGMNAESRLLLIHGSTCGQFELDALPGLATGAEILFSAEGSDYLTAFEYAERNNVDICAIDSSFCRAVSSMSDEYIFPSTLKTLIIQEPLSSSCCCTLKKDDIPGVRIIKLSGKFILSLVSEAIDQDGSSVWLACSRHPAVIMDSLGRPVPGGVEGVLHLSCDIRPLSGSSSSLKEHPLINGGTLFKTGIRASMNPDGSIKIMGPATTFKNLEKNDETSIFAKLTDLQRNLGEIWYSVLGSFPSLNDNFFEQGGTALATERAADAISSLYNIDFPVEQIYEHPVFKYQVIAVSQFRESVSGGSSLIRIPRDRKRYQASELQTGIWMLNRLEGGDSSFIIPEVIEIYGPVCPGILEEAFRQVAAKHEMLRSAFIFDGGALMIELHDAVDIKLNRTDLSMLPTGKAEELFSVQAGELVKKSFDLERPPAFRLEFFKFGDSVYKLVMPVHHIIFDGWSLGIMMADLIRFYNQLADGVPPVVFSQNKVDYIDYIAWEKKERGRGKAFEQLTYWRDKLADLPSPLVLPFQLKDREESDTAESLVAMLGESLTGNLKQLALDNHCSLFMVLGAIFSMQLSRYSGARDIIVGTAMANRREPLAAEIIGNFVNSVAIRCGVKEGDSFRELLNRYANVVLDALDNQEMPFAKINSELTRKYKRSDASFQYFVQLQNFPMERRDLSGAEIHQYELFNKSCPLNLHFEFFEEDDALELLVKYNTGLYRRDDIDLMIAKYIDLAEQIVADPDKGVSDFILQETDAESPSCYVIGDTSLTTLCLEQLLRNNFRVFGVFSDDPEVMDYAEENQLPCYRQRYTDIAGVLRKDEFDYLFSIINSTIIKQDILDMPRKLAVNYHDSPLPRYAGMYATSWALINHEVAHAVSWHVMTAEVDAGDILIQRAVGISSENDVEVLDNKCFQAALEGFGELLKKLKRGDLSGIKQDLSQRTLFGLYQRPNLIVDWRDKTENIIALVKACAIEKAENYFGSVKIMLADGRFMVVKQAETVNAATSEKTPGTVIASDDSGFIVATGDGAIFIKKCITLDGDEILINDFSPVTETQLPLLTGSDMDEIEVIQKTAVRNEYAIIKRIDNFVPPQLPVFIDNSQGEAFAAELSAGKLFSDKYGSSAFEVATAFALYLAWLCRDGRVCLVIEPVRECYGFSGLLAEKLPWQQDIDINAPFKECLEQASGFLHKLMERKTYLKDALYRHDSLKKINTFDYHLQLLDDSVMIVAQPGIDAVELISGFETFCNNAVVDEDAALIGLSNISRDEYSLQVERWNATGADYDIDEPYMVKFLRTVAEYPDKVAAAYLNNQITYGELDRKSSQLANYMLKLGGSGGKPVAVRTDRSPETAIAILAIFKTGNAYLPLDSKYPEDRIAYMLEDSGAGMLLWYGRGGAPCSLKLPDNMTVINLVYDAPGIALMPETMPDVSLSAGDMAYLMYTSGTTGKPKGVMINQRNMVNHNLAVIREFGLDSSAKTLQFASLNFDISVEEMFPTWLVGGTLIFIPDGMMENPPELFRFIDREKLTFLDLPTAYWHELVNLIDDLPMPESVKTVVIGGEKASVEHFNRWREKAEKVKLINSYGPTECTVIATISEDLSCIGHPLPNCRTYIVDKFLRPVPVGCSGELMIGGAGVGDGYLNRPDLTAEKFVESPFVPGERLYHSGDRVKYRSDGNIDFVGRVDTQIKLRGFRIEPDGIESAINQYRGIATSKVTVYNNSLAAYYTSKTGTVIDSGALKKYLQSKLPDYMVPTFLVELEAMPMTPNGKVDAKSLPAPRSETSKRVVEEKDYDHDIVSRIIVFFCEILGTGDVKSTESFFGIGGDSLKAIRLIMELEKAFGTKLKMNQLYAASTPRDIALMLARAGNVEAKNALSVVPPQTELKSSHDNEDEKRESEFISPETEKLIDIFCKVLKTDFVGPDDSFFDSGGDSLKAIRLIMEFEKAFGVKLQMEQLFSSSTPKSLSKIVFGHKPSSDGGEKAPTVKEWSALVELKEGSSQTPLFLMHTTPGDIMGYGNMVAKMDSDLPVYGLQALGLKDVEQAHNSIPEMASYYISLIKQVQPSGPYMLAGWCFGGLIAYEMAQQMVANGDKIGFLGLIETWGQPWHDIRFKLHRIKNLIQWGPVGWFKYARYKVFGKSRQDRDIRQLDFIGRAAGESSSAQEIESMKKLYRINYKAGMEYTTLPYPGQVHLFMSEVIIEGIIPDPQWGWSGLTEILPKVFTGNHANILKPPNIDQLVEIFCSEIKKANQDK